MPATWHLIERPKILRGLGLGDIQLKNLALLAKWAWRFLKDPHPLWRRLVQEKYKYGPMFSALDLQIPTHGGAWRNLCKALLSHPQSKAMIKSKIRKQVGNGMNSFFWHDSWLTDSPLKYFSPRLYLLSNSKNALVASMCLWDGRNWSWTLDW